MSTGVTIEASYRPRRRREVLSQQVSGTVVLLDPRGGSYFRLNGVGGAVWDLCDGTLTVAELVRGVSERFHQPEEAVDEDVRRFVMELAGESLLEDPD
jgi:hypothetical protein